MKIAAISSKAAGAIQNRYLYQGDFSEYDGETGYNEFDLRHYDAQVGRWTTADPYQQFASPYLGMGNSPGGMVDPDGGSVLDYFRNARGEVFWSNSTAETVFDNGELWMNIGKSYWGDQVGGYITHWLEGGASEMFKVMSSSVAQINSNFTAFGDLTAIRLETLAKQIAAYNALDHAHGQVAEPLNWFERNFIYDNSQRGFTGIDPVSGNYLVNTGVDTKGYLTYKPQITEYYKGDSPFGAVGPAGGLKALKGVEMATKTGGRVFLVWGR